MIIGVTFLVLTAPIFFPTLAEARQGYAQQPPEETLFYSADLVNRLPAFGTAPPLGSQYRKHSSPVTALLTAKNPSERDLFLGFTVLAVAALGLWRLRSNVRVLFWAFTALLMWFLESWPRPPGAGQAGVYLLPRENTHALLAPLQTSPVQHHAHSRALHGARDAGPVSPRSLRPRPLAPKQASRQRAVLLCRYSSFALSRPSCPRHDHPRSDPVRVRRCVPDGALRAGMSRSIRRSRRSLATLPCSSYQYAPSATIWHTRPYTASPSLVAICRASLPTPC